MTDTELVTLVLIVIGLAGIAVPVMPGSLVVNLGLLVYAIDSGTTRGWVILGIGVTLSLAAEVAKFLLPGRRMKQAGVPNKTLLVGALLGIGGFFVVPVIGLFIGFVLGVYLAERIRLGSHQAAWPSTKHALKAVLWSMVIEFTAGLLAALVWVVGVFVIP